MLSIEQLRRWVAKVPPDHRGQMWDIVTNAAKGRESQWLTEYVRLPVGIRTFITDPYYLGKASEIYPVVMDELEKINCGLYQEVVLTGGIGSAKTTVAVYSQAYQLYLLSCLENPHKRFGLDPSSEILIIFQSINRDLAKAVGYERFLHLIANSPYFQAKFMYDTSVVSKMVFPNRIEVRPVSGSETAAIGQNVIGGLIDELNYMAVVARSKMSLDGGEYNQAISVYSSIARRRNTRFAVRGVLPGLLCLVSSRRYPGQFTDLKEQEAKEQLEMRGVSSIYVYDKRVWDVKPRGTYSGEVFQVFVGGEGKAPRILESVGVDLDRQLVIDVPIEYKEDFERDLTNSLREIAGVSTLASHPLFTDVGIITRAMTGKSILNVDEIDLVASKLRILTDRIQDIEEPRFVHVDLGLTSDAAGIVVGYVKDFVKVTRGADIEVLPRIGIDFVLSVVPPKGGEIPFHRIREVLYALISIGIPVKWVSYDSYQSVDSLQLLRRKGLITGTVSVDTSRLPYQILKLALYDGRIRMQESRKLFTELASLEDNEKTGKIDHPVRGSKDVADALAAVVYGLTYRKELWAKHKVPLYAVPEWLSRKKDPLKKAAPESEEDSGPVVYSM
jgi:hypothetical protein